MTQPGTPARPRVLVLSFSPIHRDPRVLRQIRLFREFADVVSCGYGEAPDGVVEHHRIPDALKPWRPDFLPVAMMLGARFHERLYFDSERVRLVRRLIPPGSVDVVVANDAIAAPLAFALRPLKGIHVDLHEYAPRQGEDKTQWRLLVAPLMRWACRRYVARADSTTTVAPGIADEYARVFSMTRPLIVPNAAVYRPDLAPTAVGSPLRVVHTGVAGRGRKIEVMMDAVARANELRPGTATLDVVVVPGEQAYIDELTARATRIPGGAVRMVPPVTFDEIVPMLHRYDVGIFLCPPGTFNLRHALPNKLFEFIQARLAVVIGPSPEMMPVVLDHGLGRVASGFDAEATARLLVDLTAGEVATMKSAAHANAATLSAEQLSAPWGDAVRALAGR